MNHLDLVVPKGSVFGLLGPNGSGKTTTLGMVLGVTNPTEGEVLWFGEPARKEHRKRIGAILENPNFYPNYSGYKNLQVMARIKGVPDAVITPIIAQVGLKGREHDAFKAYSLGMKQRLAIAGALLANPEVLILDEPTNGLDPQGISDIRQLIRDIAMSGKTIILASHLLDEVQKVCDTFAVLKLGNLLYTGKVEVDFGDATQLQIAAPDAEKLIHCLEAFPGYKKHHQADAWWDVTFESTVTPLAVSQYLAQQEVFVHHFIQVKKNLEQQFLEILSQHA